MFKGTIENGVLLEVRELRTTKDNKVWRTLAKIAFTGGTVEGIMPPGLVVPAAGSPVRAEGHHESGNRGTMDFVLDSVTENSKK